MNAPALMLYAVLCSAILAIAAACLETLCTARQLALRWIWILTIAMSVCMPLSSMFSTSTSIPTTPAASQMPELGGGPAIAGSSVTTSQGFAATLAAGLTRRLEQFEPALRVVMWSALLVVPLLIGVEWVRLRHARRSWREGTLCGVAVLVAESFGPAVVDVITPRIVVPAFALTLPAHQQQLLLAHEEEHVHKHDGRWSLVMLLLVALAPWNPLLWWQYARFRLAIELDCDQRVLARGKPAHAYGTLLIDMAARSQRASLMATAFLEHHTSSLQRRIAHIVEGAPRLRRVHRLRMVLAAALGAGSFPLMFILPRPSMPQRPRTAAEFVADSGAIAVMELNRAGRWTEAEAMGRGFLAARPPSAESGESCAVLLGVTYAQVLLQKRSAAVASMARFDSVCANAVYTGFIPAESDRVRRMVNGEDANSVYQRSNIPITAAGGGATAVMMLNRERRYDEAERTGSAFLASMERRTGEPEACAVLIGVTFAQAVQRRSADAKQSLARFDRECTGVMYLDWFPGESARVRRVVNGEPPGDVYDRAFVPR